MTPVSPEDLLALAVRSARTAGDLLAARFGDAATGIAAKSTRTDLVSDADREAEALIAGMIRAERPDDELVGEEGAAAPGRSGLRWLVDPLDGTINYLWAVPQWSVSVACLDAEGGLVGVVHDPTRGETFTAVRGRGARRGETPLVLTGGIELGEALLGTGFGYDPERRALQIRRLRAILPAVRDVRRFGSAALDLAWVACGRLDAFYETGLNPWDGAAGAVLVREAGGTVEDLPPRDGLPEGIIAARPGLAGRLRALVDAPLPA
jgi:myo-inositol-1(or 4)-monophosphatase